MSVQGRKEGKSESLKHLTVSGRRRQAFLTEAFSAQDWLLQTSLVGQAAAEECRARASVLLSSCFQLRCCPVCPRAGAALREPMLTLGTWSSISGTQEKAKTVHRLYTSRKPRTPVLFLTQASWDLGLWGLAPKKQIEENPEAAKTLASPGHH